MGWFFLRRKGWFEFGFHGSIAQSTISFFPKLTGRITQWDLRLYWANVNLLCFKRSEWIVVGSERSFDSRRAGGIRIPFEFLHGFPMGLFLSMLGTCG